jgi:glycosyltransferase involved in cell wall biosynthesis
MAPTCVATSGAPATVATATGPSKPRPASSTPRYPKPRTHAAIDMTAASSATLPSISLIIPALNEERNLPRSIGSIVRQDYPHDLLEVIVADGGSNDRTIAVAKAAAGDIPVRIVDNSARKEAEWGKALGLETAGGDLVQFMDADMWLTSPSMLRRLSVPLAEDEDLAGSIAPYAFLSELPLWSRFLSLDPFQRDPLFEALTPGIGQFLVEKRPGFWVCEFPDTRIPPVGGTTLFRRREIDVGRWGGHFREVDHPAYLVSRERNRFAFVPDQGWGHEHCRSLGELVRKRIRNLRQLDTSFLSDVPRDFVWLDLSRRGEKTRLILWVLATHLLVPRLLEGVQRWIRTRRWESLLRPVAALAITDALLFDLIATARGRRFLMQTLRPKAGRELKI